jgi:hypothetical protein
MKKKMICMVLVSLFVFAGHLSIVVLANNMPLLYDGDEDELDQKNDETYGGTFNLFAGGGFKYSQSFKPTKDIVTRIYLHRGGGSATGGGDPKMNEIALRETLDGNNLAYLSKELTLEDDFEWIEFDIPDTVVEPEKTYYILFGTMRFQCDVSWLGTGWKYQGDPYSRGEAIYYDYTCGKWMLHKYKDMHFKTYGRNGTDGNHPPGEIELISSTTEGKIDDITFKFRSSDVDDDKIKYKIELRKKPELGSFEKGEEIITELFNPSEVNSVNLKISTPAVYWMTITALDEHNAESPNKIDLGPIYVTDYKNSAPNKPLLSGEDIGQTYKEYEYDVTTWDCDKDQIWYLFDWGDGEKSEWIGPYENGETCKARHRWTIFFSKNSLRVKARDSSNKESEWSDVRIVIMQKEKIKGSILNTALTNFLYNHPILRAFIGLYNSY